VSGHVHGESSVGDLSESELSSRSSSSDSSDSSSSSHPLESPLLLGLVLAMVPGKNSVLSGGPSVWG